MRRGQASTIRQPYSLVDTALCGALGSQGSRANMFLKGRSMLHIKQEHRWLDGKVIVYRGFVHYQVDHTTDILPRKLNQYSTRQDAKLEALKGWFHVHHTR